MNVNSIDYSTCREYKNSEVSNQAEFCAIENQNVGNEDEILGIGFLHNPHCNISYGMAARFSENSTSSNPIIKVSVNKGGKDAEEYEVNINEINTSNATEIEMFALCNYADATGMGTGGKFGSWQSLNYYRINANALGKFEMSNSTEEFIELKQDWKSMIGFMINKYIKAGIYDQAMDGKKLLYSFETLLKKGEHIKQDF